ncbi:DUF4231 domain-containing protein [Amycolatopsis kentuckyensis]|uniref:DUF4231 domain-containing protein n=1 Tax=Amycolatopsis kentuckyensis TaxID=218823 RepID=UPI00356A5C2A
MNKPSRKDDAMTSEAIALLWDRQSVWSQAANRLKIRISRARVLVLVLTVAGAVFGAASASLTQSAARVCAAVAAVALALAAVAARGTASGIVRDWTRARSVSESLKSDVYTYLAGAGAFRGPDRDEAALRELTETSALAGDLLRHTTGVVPTPRDLPPVRDVETYTTVRVRGQLDDYYRPKSLLMAARVRLAQRCETGLAAAAAILASLAAAFPGILAAAWVGVLTTVTTAITAHASAARYAYQQVEFTRTADELERLLAERRTNRTSDDRFVAEAERVISIQNEGWMAKLGSAARPAQQ